MSAEATTHANEPIRPAGARPATLPSALAVGIQRGGIEIKQFFRERDAVVFTFSFPVIMLLIFGSIFSGEIEDTGVDYRQMFIAGMIAVGIMSTSFSSLAINIATERDDGTLKRLRGTPMPRSAYFVGKVLLVCVTTLTETVILVGLSAFAFDLELPADGGHWFTFAWVLLLGMSACTLFGVAVSSLPRSGRSAAAVITPPFVVLQFISGVFFPPSQLPDYLRTIGALFPLKWMTQGLRSVFLPDQWLLGGQESTGSWEHGRMAIVLAAWVIGALMVSVYTFRWTGRRDG